MITYKDCPECGTRRIHESVRLCEVCETWEKAEQAIAAQDEILTRRYNEQLARAEKAEAKNSKYRECLETIHYSFKMGNVVSGPMLQTWAEFIEKALNNDD